MLLVSENATPSEIQWGVWGGGGGVWNSIIQISLKYVIGICYQRPYSIKNLMRGVRGGGGGEGRVYLFDNSMWLNKKLISRGGGGGEGEWWKSNSNPIRPTSAVGFYAKFIKMN